MKHSVIGILIAGLVVSGCGKQEEPPAAPQKSAASPAATPAAPAEKSKPTELKATDTNTAPTAPTVPAANAVPAAAALPPAVPDPTTPALVISQAPTNPANEVIPAAPAASNSIAGMGQALRDSALQSGMGMLSNRLAKARGETGALAPTALATATTGSPLSALTASLPLDSVTQGLKQALGKGLERAVAELGKSGGFLTNLNVKIPMPPAMQRVETTLRSLGQDQLANDFIATMNSAAEKAVPASATVFTNALAKLTLQDAQSILQGGPDAATQFFRKTTEVELREKFMPIVREATAKAGVTTAYKQLMSKAQFAAPLLGRDTVDLDSYIATKSMDGLFKMVAEEEKRIRENPAARSTELLKSVFGLLGK